MKKNFRSLMILLTGLAIFCGFEGCTQEIKEIEKKVYICPKCETPYDTAKKAADCCGVQYVDKTYCAPVIFESQDAGDGKIKVIMMTATEDAVIYYTTDGTKPTEKSKKYTASLTFTEDTIIKAVSVKAGIENSSVAVATVSIVEKIITHTEYVCPKCYEKYDTAKKAAECCGVQIEYVEKNYCAPVVFETQEAGEGKIKVIMITATEDATIYYTTDGSKPDTESEVYTTSVTFTEDAVIKAIAVKEGIENSPTSVAKISIVEKTITNTEYVCPRCYEKYATAKEAAECCGVQIEYVDKIYCAPVVFEAQESGNGKIKVIMITATEDAVIYYTTDGSKPDAESTVYTAPVTFTEDVIIKAIAVKEGIENSPASLAKISVVEKTITNTEYVCPRCYEKYATAKEAAECCGVQIEYVDKIYCAPVVFEAQESGNGKIKVIMITATEDAVIYYTTDGSKPDAESEVYTTPVTFTEDVVIKAIAVKEGIENSPTSVAKISIVEKTITTPEYVEKTYCAPVTYTSENLGKGQIKVFMTTDTEDAVIYYTTDGTNPTTESTVYTTPVIFTEDTVIKAIAVKTGIEKSPVSVGAVSIVDRMIFSSVISKTGIYAVYHLQQKVTGGKAVTDYELFETEAKRSLQKDSSIDVIKKTYEGFNAKVFTQNENAIYVYYDRALITYTFQTSEEGKFEDNSTSKEVSGLYGASYTVPRKPYSATYQFLTWKDSDENTPPLVFGAENKTFNAVWKIMNTFVRVPGVYITGNETWTPESQIFVPKRRLTIPDLLVCDHEVTRGEYIAVMGEDPSSATAYDDEGYILRGDETIHHPVDSVNWYKAIIYCNKLSMQEYLTPCYSVYDSTNPDDWGSIPSYSSSTPSNWYVTCNFDANGYRLPTEAEWEWFARGGENYIYAGSDNLDEVAWCTENTSSNGTREVKTKQPNGYGLYDVSGNVTEWCWDIYNGGFDQNSSEYESTQRVYSSSNSYICYRGGCYFSGDGYYCEVSSRDYYYASSQDSGLGFRVVCSASN